MAMKLLFPYDKREPLKDIGVAFKEYIRHEGSGQEYNVTDSNFKALWVVREQICMFWLLIAEEKKDGYANTIMKIEVDLEDQEDL